MRTFRLFTFSFIFTAFFAASVFAQAAPKIAMVDTEAFYNQGGIKKIEVGYKSLQSEFSGLQKQLDTMATRIQTLQKELQTLQQQANDPKNKVPINETQVSAKVEEFQDLQKELKRKEEDAKTQYEKREGEVMSPISRDIGNSLGEYAKTKGFTLVLDSSKLIRSGILLYLQETTDITTEFIQFYNARPAGSATK